jgi:hypothetical protein
VVLILLVPKWKQFNKTIVVIIKLAWKGKMKKLEQDSIVIYSALAKGVGVRVSKDSLV